MMVNMLPDPAGPSRAAFCRLSFCYIAKLLRLALQVLPQGIPASYPCICTYVPHYISMLAFFVEVVRSL